MLVYLLRHGRAEDGFGMRDEDRALTPDGWERLRAAAPAWQRLIEPIDVVFVSPLRRAQETAEVLVESTTGAREQRTTAAIVPGGSLQKTLELIETELVQGTPVIAFVGHEPHLGCLLSALITGDEGRSVPLKKGMLVGVELPIRTSLIGELRLSLTQRAAAEFDATS